MGEKSVPRVAEPGFQRRVFGGFRSGGPEETEALEGYSKVENAGELFHVHRFTGDHRQPVAQWPGAGHGAVQAAVLEGAGRAGVAAVEVVAGEGQVVSDALPAVPMRASAPVVSR